MATVQGVNIPHPGLPSTTSLRFWSARLVVLASALGLPPAASAAQPAAPSPIPPAVLARAATLAGDAARATAPPHSRVVAEPGVLDPRLTLAPCAAIEPYLPAGVPAWGATRVGLRCTRGPVAWRVFLPVNIQIWAPGVVSAVTLPGGARLTGKELKSATVDWAVAGGAFDDPAQLEGRTLTHPLAAGQAVHPGDLQPRQWFDFGETVRVVLGGEGFSVSTQGQALTRGIDGQIARVRTDGGRVVVGRAVGDHCVEVSL